MYPVPRTQRGTTVMEERIGESPPLKQKVKRFILMIPVHILVILWAPISISGFLAERYEEFVWDLNKYPMGAIDMYKQWVKKNL